MWPWPSTFQPHIHVTSSISQVWKLWDHLFFITLWTNRQIMLTDRVGMNTVTKQMKKTLTGFHAEAFQLPPDKTPCTAHKCVVTDFTTGCQQSLLNEMFFSHVDTQCQKNVEEQGQLTQEQHTHTHIQIKLSCCTYTGKSPTADTDYW